jgi:hypothetical protein
MPSRWRSRIKERSNSAKAPITERISFATALLAGGGELFDDEVDRDSLPGQLRDDRAEVVQVPGEAVHRVHDHGVAVAHEVHQRCELGAGYVSPRDPLDEGAIDGHTLELAGMLWSSVLTLTSPTRCPLIASRSRRVRQDSLTLRGVRPSMPGRTPP